MEEDYIRKGAIGALVVIVSLVALGAIPAYSVGVIALRRINILSQIIDYPEQPITTEIHELEID